MVKVLPYHPFLVKPNNHELGDIFGVKLSTREEVIPYGKKLQEMGAQNVLISMAGEGAVLIAADGQCLEAPAPKGKLVNGVGAGDSMVADLSPDGSKRRITHMPSAWESPREVPALFPRIWQQKKKSCRY